VTVGVLALTLFALVSACGKPANTGGAQNPPPTSAAATTPAGGDGTVGSAQTTPASGGGKTTQPPATGPRIVYFRVSATGKPSCPAGTNLNPIPGKDVTLEWQAAAVDGTQLAVDGPGLYGSYGPQDTVTLAFPCSGKAGTQQSHTYTLRTVGGGPERTQTLTVKALINEISQV